MEGMMGERRVTTGWTRVRWTAAMREAFLDTLARECNVTLAAEAAGVRKESAYLLRRKEPAFRDAWQEALALGYQALETRMLARAINPASEPDLDEMLGFRLLTRHGNALNGKVPRTGVLPRAATREETDAAILKKIEMLERARAKGLA
ncbi:hypothetical protein ACFQ1E_04420 [Sphingomonas canadensis]|uniref:Terminase small subunit n=1 Tax=Sphingomonas canadensis TaxID=1219257 RepID=A0ABW3H8E5_9SPHN|nr:hypothetical protein [Sphingomonas canadensis]MCW3834511.1 hypothetical protein [Sphingomonas canadensis]